jgi:hypothetical protein
MANGSDPDELALGEETDEAAVGDAAEGGHPGEEGSPPEAPEGEAPEAPEDDETCDPAGEVDQLRQEYEAKKAELDAAQPRGGRPLRRRPAGGRRRDRRVRRGGRDVLGRLRRKAQRL